jgi:hypothetical protein
MNTVCKEQPPIWYTKKELYNWLIHENYSKQIAEELSEKWAISSQMAFAKGWEKAFNDKEAGTFDYVYYPKVTVMDATEDEKWDEIVGEYIKSDEYNYRMGESKYTYFEFHKWLKSNYNAPTKK